MSTMDQIARDILEGSFPKKSDATLREESQGCTADPPEVVLDRLFDMNRPKSEAEHMAARVIEAMAHRLSCPFDKGITYLTPPLLPVLFPHWWPTVPSTFWPRSWWQVHGPQPKDEEKAKNKDKPKLFFHFFYPNSVPGESSM